MEGVSDTVSSATDFRNRGDKVQDNIKHTQDTKAKRTAKNSVFLDLFQNKSYLLKLYKTLHPEDATATEDSLTDVQMTSSISTSFSVRFLTSRQNSMG